MELERDYVHRIEMEGLPDTPATREPRRLFLAANTGYFQVLSFNISAPAFVGNVKESRYVGRIIAYLAVDIF